MPQPESAAPGLPEPDPPGLPAVPQQAQPQASQLMLGLSFLAATLIWGSTWLVIRTQLGSVPPSWSVTYRFLIGGTAVLLWALAARRPFRLGWRGHGFALTTGLFQFVLNFNLVYRAELYVTSGLVALVFTLLVIANAALAAVVLGQRVTRRFIAGSVMGIGGVALLAGGEIAASPHVATGLLLAVGAVAVASVSNVLQATALARRLPVEPALALAMLYGAAMNGAWAWATTGPPVFGTAAAYWAGLAYLGIVASAGAFMIYYALIRRVGAAAAGYVNVLVPVVAMTLSTVFEGYRWTWAAAVGVGLALAGLAVALRGRRA